MGWPAGQFRPLGVSQPCSSCLSPEAAWPGGGGALVRRASLSPADTGALFLPSINATLPKTHSGTLVFHSWLPLGLPRLCPRMVTGGALRLQGRCSRPGWGFTFPICMTLLSIFSFCQSAFLTPMRLFLAHWLQPGQDKTDATEARECPSLSGRGHFVTGFWSRD